MTIGVLARACGLTPSALRFYDDCGLLVPARVDEVTGYRYYRPAQGDRAVLIRRLRGIGVSLEVISEILSGDTDRARRLLDAHVVELEARAREAAVVARAVRQVLGGRVVLSGAVFAEAVEQVRVAAAVGGEIPVLGGVLVEAAAGAVTLTATDRYRLSTRSVVPVRAGPEWSVVVDAGGLGEVSSWLREVHEVEVEPGAGALMLAGGGVERRCRTIDEVFPNYRTVLTGLAPVRTRVVMARDLLLDAFEGDAVLACSIDQTGVAAGPGARLPARVTGSAVALAFSSATLRPALVGSVGPEIMLDIAGPDQPVVVRSATDGDLTTLVMPTAMVDTKEHSS